jgi:hypothetical protein
VSAEIVINTVLRANATVMALTFGRVSPLMAAQGTEYPYVTYQRIATERLRCTEGPSLLASALMQLTIFDGRSGYDVYASVREIAEAVRKALDGYSGTAGGVVCPCITVDGERDQPIFPSDGGDQPIAGIQIDVSVWYEETPVET